MSGVSKKTPTRSVSEGTRNPAADVAWKARWRAEIGEHVIALAWSPDSSALAAAAVGGPISVFEAGTGRIRHVLPGHDFGTTALSWSPQGGLLASAGQDGKVRFWNVAGGQMHRSLDGGAAWVERATWSPDGTLLATAAGKKVRLWNAAGQLMREYGNHPSTVADIQWKPGTMELASAAYGQIALFHPDKAEPVRLLKWKGSQLVLAWSPNGKHMATGDQDSTVHFWIMKSGEDLMMSGYLTKVRELAWDYTSRYLATGGGRVPCVWDVSGKGPAGTTPQQLEGHTANVTSLAFQHAGPLLASAGADGLVMLWHPGKHKRALARAQAASGFTQIAWSPDDQWLGAGTESGAVLVYARLVSGE
jgi:WD40 repeat protein